MQLSSLCMRNQGRTPGVRDLAVAAPDTLLFTFQPHRPPTRCIHPSLRSWDPLLPITGPHNLFPLLYNNHTSLYIRVIMKFTKPAWVMHKGECAPTVLALELMRL